MPNILKAVIAMMINTYTDSLKVIFGSVHPVKNA